MACLSDKLPVTVLSRFFFERRDDWLAVVTSMMWQLRWIRFVRPFALRCARS